MKHFYVTLEPSASGGGFALNIHIHCETMEEAIRWVKRLFGKGGPE